MSHPRHIGIAGVSVEGALLCVRHIHSAADLLPPDRRPQVTLHFLPFIHYSDAASRSDRPAVAELLLTSLNALHRAGADFAIIPANAPHLAFDLTAPRSPIPLLNLIELTADACRPYSTVAILGVRWTMRAGLYTQPLARRGIRAIVPDEPDQETIHRIITDELFYPRFVPESTDQLLSIVNKLKANGAQAVALACTELPLVLNETNCGIPAIDTTRLLAESALNHATDAE